MHDHEVIAVVGKGQWMERGDDLDLAETARFGHSISGEAGRCLLSDNKAGLPGHAGFGRDQGSDIRVIETDL